MSESLNHPRLFFTPESLADLRAKACDEVPNPFMGTFREAWGSLEAAARQYLTEDSFSFTYYGDKVVNYPLPPQEPPVLEDPPGFTAGRYPYWTAMCFGIKSRLESLALAHAITGEEAFGRRAREYALALASWSTWNDRTYNCNGGKTCLDTGYLTQGMATAYDLLYPLLREEERNQVSQAILALGLEPLYTDTATTWDHNIQMVRNSALGFGALALLGEVAEAELYLERAIDSFRWYLDRRASVRETEAMLYTSVSLDHCLRFGDALLRVTGRTEIMRHPWVTEELVPWVTYFLAPGGKGLVNFSDARIFNYFGPSFALLAAGNRNGLAGWYLKETQAAAGTLPGFLHLSSSTPIASPEEQGLRRSAHFPRIGWVALRTGWSASDLLLAFQASPSAMGHNHFDQNHFVLNVAGEWLITDPGYQDYSPGPKNDVTEGTLGHNALLVNGQGQVVKGGGRVTAYRSTPLLDYVAGEAASAYVGVRTWHREICLAGPDYLLVRDRVALAEPGESQLLVHTDAQGQLDVSGKRFRITKAGAWVEGQVLLPSRAVLQRDVVNGAEEWGPFARIQDPGRHGNTQFLWLLLPGKADQPAAARVVQFAAEAGQVRLVLEGAGWTDTWTYEGESPMIWERRRFDGTLIDSATLRGDGNGSPD